MLSYSEKCAELVRAARREVEVHNAMMPTDRFYLRKLDETWRRARQCPGYAHLGDWSLAAFRALPATTRQTIRARPADFATTHHHPVRYYETSGTTGVPVPAPRLIEDIVWNTVAVAVAWRQVLDPDERVAILLPSDVVPVGDLVAQVCDFLDLPHVRAYPFATGITDWDRLIDLWHRFQPTSVFLAPGLALQYTRLLQQRGLLADLRRPVRRLMLLGEVNTAPFRERLGGWWAARAYDASYGSTETGTLAATCPAGRQHLLPAAHHFELDTGTEIVPLDAAEQGRLVVTPLNSYARPLLRLDTGDTVSISGGCPCGRSTPLVTVHGRATEALRVHGVALLPHAVEEVVYASTRATGYLVELDPAGRYARLLLERQVTGERGAEPETIARVQRASRRLLGLEWDQVAFVNSLPVRTKSGASQKNWKRSNVRVLESL